MDGYTEVKPTKTRTTNVMDLVHMDIQSGEMIITRIEYELLKLKHVDKLSMQEIADVLCISKEEVIWLQNKTLYKLRDVYLYHADKRKYLNRDTDHYFYDKD